MLKIKDNVDLKELEKFGFKYDEYNKVWIKQLYTSDCDLIVDANRFIYHENYSTADMNYHATGVVVAIFDLIQSNMVEKVAEE